jgi:hypothetical protein
MEFLDRDGGVAAAAMKAMWTTAVHSLETVERGVAALNVRVSVGVTVRNILRCFQRRLDGGARRRRARRRLGCDDFRYGVKGMMTMMNKGF